MNPNFGTTNFDNVCYAILMVFQCVTMEGWSDIQQMLEMSFSKLIPIYFLPLVFIGAFFLLNLTLAVINSKFTEAHNEMAAEAAAQLASRSFRDGDGDDDDDNPTLEKFKDQMSIEQFITARVYAKKMIEFLRMR